MSRESEFTSGNYEEPKLPEGSGNGLQTVLSPQLQERVRDSGVLFKPRRRGYYLGENIQAEVHGLDGKKIGTEKFSIEHSPGSGFAGQVYRAIPESGVIYDASQKTEGENKPVAVKVLRPKSPLKELFRDTLFKLSFQTSFASTIREEAMRSGLIWQELLRTAAGIELGTDTAITRPFGYFWDAEIKSFTEIHEWIDGRAPRYEADDQMILRAFKRGSTPDSEMKRKKQFMGQVVGICNEVGALGIARQYEWHTFVAQANVLTRRDFSEGKSEFVVVDARPGLAVPFFLPLSPTHLRIIFNGLRRGVFVHFDEVDFKKLDRYLAAHTEAFAPVDGLIQQLKEDDERYRNGLPNMWQTRTKILTGRDFRQKVREATVGDWEKLDKVSKQEGDKLKDGSQKYLPYLLLDNTPIIGQRVMRLLGNERYRQHLKNILTKPGYFLEAVETIRANDLIEWVDGGRIGVERGKNLAGSFLPYALDKVVLSGLPRSMHRFATDAEKRRQVVQNLISDPVRLSYDKRFREEWLSGIIDQQCERGVIRSEQVSVLKDQIADGRMQGFIKDLGFIVGLEFVSTPIYAALAAYGISTGDFLPLVVAAGPISPSGIIREAYVLGHLLHELPSIAKHKDSKLFLTRSLGVATAPWRVVGNIFPVLEMFAYYNDMSLLLGDYFVQKMVDKIPVFGGEGKLLEYWAFNTVYNFPLSIKKAILDGKNSAK